MSKRPANGAKIVIVAHRVGRLVSRYRIERPGGKEQVEQLILRGTPNYGLPRSFLALSGSAGSPLLRFMKEKTRSIPPLLPS